MRFLRTFLLSVVLTCPLWSATPASPEAVPQLRGIVSADGERVFSLVAPGDGASKWVKIGASFAGWELTDFKTADESLTLKKDGRTVVVKMEGSSIANAGAAGGKATLADAQEVLRKMDFERMMTRMLDQQKKTMTDMFGQMGGAAGVNAADREDMAAMQNKMMSAIFDSMNLAEMKNDMAKVYSETFTGDELRGLADFYSTPAGQAMVEKQPEVTQRLNALMMPRLMAAMPKIQAMAGEMAAEQAAMRRAPAPAPTAK